MRLHAFCRRRDRLARAFAVAAAGVVSCVAASVAQAQTPSAEQLQLFARIQAQPTDYESNFAYARASVAARDYEGAIVALERLLFFNPALTRAKYDLGALYFRLRSFDMAIRYFEDALASPALEDEIRQRIAIMLPAARKEAQPSRFYGVLQMGLGYNSNVPGVPGFGLVRSYGATIPNPGPYYATPGGNVVLLGKVLHVYDFQNQRGDTFETQVSGIGTGQFRMGELSSALAEVTSGPRLALTPDALPGVTVRPYVVGSFGALAGGRNASSAGVGVSLRAQLGETFSIEPGFEWRRLWIGQTDTQLQSASLTNTGPDWTGSLSARWSPLERLTFNARGFLGRNASLTGALSSRRAGAEVSAKVDFDAPFEGVGWRWSATPFVRYTTTRFDAPDPVVDPFVARADRQLRAGAQFDMPVTQMLGVSALIQYTRENSNIPNYRATSWSGLIGPTLRF